MTNKKVTFGELTVHQHTLELGDNPSVSDGAPLTLGWKCESSVTRNLDLYEFLRGPRRGSRKELSMSLQERATILLEQGYSLSEISHATLQVDVTKKQRAESLRDASMGVSATFLSLFKRTKQKRNTLQARSA